MPDAFKNSMNQVNSTCFIFSLLFSHILILIRIQNKQAAGTKTSKHFIESTGGKKIHTVKFNTGTPSLLHVRTHIDRKANKYENQLEIRGLSFIGRLPSPTISFANRKVIFMCNRGGQHSRSLHLTLAAQDSYLGSSEERMFMAREQAHLGWGGLANFSEGPEPWRPIIWFGAKAEDACCTGEKDRNKSPSWNEVLAFLNLMKLDTGC